ncbi:MAG: S8 family serine peptidase [Pseudomonadota bacterium]
MAKAKRGGGRRGGGGGAVFEGFDDDSSEREEAKKAEERAREDAKHAEEEAREAAKKESGGDRAKEEHSSASDEHDDREGGDGDRRGASSSHDDGNKEKSDGSGSGGDGTRRSAGKGDGALPQPLPRTVEELFRRMFAGNGNAKDKGEKPSDKGRARPHADLPDSGFAATRRAEMLALNADRRAIERAKALGFKVERPQGLGRLKLEVTRLIAPDGMSQEQADAALRREVPATAIARNERYRIYRTATGTAARAADSSGIEEAGRAPCSEDRCFGPRLIGWQPTLGACAAGIGIGVIDTAVDMSHPVFKNRAIEVGHLASAGRPAPQWHGTGVLALLAGDGARGVPGLVSEARFSVADVFFAGEDGLPTTDTASLLAALDWLDQREVRIINMSLSGPKDALVEKAITTLARKGTIFVAAAGNDGPAARPSYPAAYPPVIAVTAVGRDLKSYRHASHGDYIDLAAPGVSILTALPDGKVGFHSGTSFATPYVTATLAALYRQLPRASKEEALRHVAAQDLGAPGRDPIYGAGLLVAPSACTGGSAVAANAGAAARLSAPREQLPWLALSGPR